MWLKLRDTIMRFVISLFLFFVNALIALRGGSASADSRAVLPANRICFMSDLNGSYGSVSLPVSVDESVTQLRRLQCGLVVGAGDLVAGQDSSLSDSQLHSMWDGFRKQVLQPLDELNVPVLSALGNHDASAARGSSGGYIYNRERKVASEFWAQRKAEANYGDIEWLSTEDFPFFYSIRFGTTAVIFIDGSSATEIRMKRGWLESQLQALAAHPSVHTRMVVGHLPLVAVAQGRERPGEILADSRELYELFDSYKVDFYVSGHHHAFYPGRVDEWSRKHGTVQLALGALGNGPRKLLGQYQVAARNTLTYLDIDASIAQGDMRFSLSTLFPRTGDYLMSQSLPESLAGFDGLGNAVRLRRVVHRTVFPFPFP